MMPQILKHLFCPHRSNNHRARLLQPAGLSVLIGLFLLSQSSLRLLEMMPQLPGGLVLGYASSITPEQVVDLTNGERELVNLPPLRINSGLNQAAVAKANHMFSNDYWAHVAPDGTTPWVFIKEAGYKYSVAGENLARDFGDSQSMVQAWMASSTHRDNIINEKYQEIGIAVVDGKLEGVETTLVVQMFGAPVVSAARVEPETRMEVESVAPVVEVVEEPETVAVANLPVNLAGERITRPETLSATAIRISPTAITKTIALSMVLLLTALLLYDAWVMSRRQIPRLVGKNWAHISLYSVVLMLIVAISQGKVL